MAWSRVQAGVRDMRGVEVRARAFMGERVAVIATTRDGIVRGLSPKACDGDAEDTALCVCASKRIFDEELGEKKREEVGKLF